jgi:hypothetical protein
MLHNDVVVLTDKMDVIHTKENFDCTECRNNIRAQVKFMFSVVASDIESVGDLALRLEYKKGDLTPRCMNLNVCVDHLFGYWHGLRGADIIPFAVPGYTPSDDEYISCAEWPSMEVFESVGLDILVTGLFGWTLERAYVPRPHGPTYAIRVQVWPI